MYNRRFSPFQDLEAIREQINQAFEPMVRSVVQECRPASLGFPIELTESPVQYKLRASLPGIDPAKIDVQATDRTLSIAAEFLPAEYAEGEVVHLKELHVGKFRRSLELDESIEPDKIEASYNQGVLTLTIPKLQASREKSVKVDIKTS